MCLILLSVESTRPLVIDAKTPLYRFEGYSGVFLLIIGKLFYFLI